ncbi:hypothetical protein N7539_001427 [Penicillium diatomitis]|uniref:NAD(P)-binding protein n=1 Tax=Penicillium diatomitis TaxID=2819901 RepID=A0A9W9XGQ4_9EURO|nr:uncharacterized protein N7539_001427 [Penicillium diatomitis]KAJ5492681.1 hypothetical protein N7539_001427 [Penicillium diatomitis]
MGLIFSSSPRFNPRNDIPGLSGKVIFVTGGNTGLGKETILQLAKHNPERIYLGARSEAKAKAAIGDIKETVPTANIIFLQLDLASLKSVKKAAETLLSETDRLDILVNNAGVMLANSGLTEDGYEINFGTNYMGPVLLTKLLLPLLERTATAGKDVRIINVSSELYKAAPKRGILFEENKTPLADLGTLSRYGQSKLANAYYTKILAEKYPAIKSAALHPGLVRTNIAEESKGSSIFMSLLLKVSEMAIAVDVETGALNQLWASTSNEVQTGEYYLPVGKAASNGLLKNRSLALKLWEWTEAELKTYIS